MGAVKDEVIAIDKSKIYSSYFARAIKIFPDKMLVSISITTPENWRGAYLRELRPPVSLLYSYKNGLITTEEYEEVYRKEVLDWLNAREIADKLRGKVICCWERSGSFCHRHIVLKWLGEELGEHIIGGEI